MIKENKSRNWQASWITASRELGDVVPVFCKKFITCDNIKNVMLYISALGVYEATLNGR